MRGLLLNQVVAFLLIFAFGLLIWACLLGSLYPIHLIKQIPFFFDLIEFHQSIPQVVIYISGFINFLLIYQIAKKIFVKSKALIPLLVFSLSPWSAYLIFAGSYYIFLLTLVMSAFYGLLLLRSGKRRLGMGLFVVTAIMSLYGSLLMVLILPILIAALILNRFVTFRTIKPAIFLIIVFSLPLFVSVAKNQAGLKNIFTKEAAIFSDPGLISTVNDFQGETRREGFNFITRLVENKYVYLSKFAVLKAIKQVTPSTFFTSQESLLKFSFSPPIFFGFLAPFLYGLFLIISSGVLRKYLFISLILIIPSFLAKSLVDLNRLILFEPVLIFIVSFGFIKLLEHRNRLYKVILFVSIVVVFIQFFVTIFDIDLREYPRYKRYFGESFELKVYEK